MRRLVLLFIPLALAACGDSGTEPQSSSTALNVQTQLSGTTFKQGEAVGITVTITNVSSDTVSLDLVCTSYVQILWMGHDISPSHDACTAIIRQKALAPNEDFVVSGPWAGSATNGGGDGTVPPGTYQIRGIAPFRARDGSNQISYGPAVSVRLVP